MVLVLFFSSTANALPAQQCSVHMNSKVSSFWQNNKYSVCQELKKNLAMTREKTTAACLSFAEVDPAEVKKWSAQVPSDQCSTTFTTNDLQLISTKMKHKIDQDVAQEFMRELEQYNNLIQAPFLEKNWPCFGSGANSVQVEDFINEVTRLKSELLNQAELFNAKEKSAPNKEEASFWKKAKDFLDRNSKSPLADLHPAARIAASALLGALSWRVRGGAGNLGTTTKARWLGLGLPFMGLGYLNGGVDGLIAGFLMVPPVHLGWADWMSMGRNGNSSKSNDVMAMTVRGLMQTSLSGSYLWARGYGPGMLLSGAAMGPCYWGAWEYYPNKAKPRVPFFGSYLLDGPTSVGELCTGAAYGGAMSAVLGSGRN